MSSIYLDYNATAPLHPKVKAAMVAVMDEPLNPSSIHANGRHARKLVDDSRRRILQSVNAEALVFCGSGTEANNLALAQVARVQSLESSIVISAIEHDSVFKTPNPKIIPVDSYGIIDLYILEKTLSILDSSHSTLISIMLANNETGVIQPIKQAAEITHKYGALIHCDAVQGFGKIPIDFKDLGVDLMTISCHKIGGPLGVAALVHKPGLDLKPLMFGGGQEKNKRPGTENVAAIVGFAKIADSRLPNADLRDYLESAIGNHQSAIIYGKVAPRLPNTTCLAMPNIASATQLIHFDTNNISISTGSACSSGKVEVSRVLTAMKAPLAANAIRISTGWATTKEDMDAFLKCWRELNKRSQEKVA